MMSDMIVSEWDSLLRDCEIPTSGIVGKTLGKIDLTSSSSRFFKWRRIGGIYLKVK